MRFHIAHSRNTSRHAISPPIDFHTSWRSWWSQSLSVGGRWHCLLPQRPQTVPRRRSGYSIDKLCPETMSDAETTERLTGALLGGQALAESSAREDLVAEEESKTARVKQWLIRVICATEMRVIDRTKAGDVLGILGDPRMNPAMYSLPADPMAGFVRVPRGPFWMGSDSGSAEADNDEQPFHEVVLGDYYVSKWPVTVGQYRAFVVASGYNGTTKTKSQGRVSHPVTQRHANHPVIVGLDDAWAYARWLTEWLPRSGDTPRELSRLVSDGWRVMLPSEAEWEKAARGTDGRVYPWGHKSDINCANYNETGVGGTTAVGMFSERQKPVRM